MFTAQSTPLADILLPHRVSPTAAGWRRAGRTGPAAACRGSTYMPIPRDAIFSGFRIQEGRRSLLLIAFLFLGCRAHHKIGFCCKLLVILRCLRTQCLCCTAAIDALTCSRYPTHQAHPLCMHTRYPSWAAWLSAPSRHPLGCTLAPAQPSMYRQRFRNAVCMYFACWSSMDRDRREWLKQLPACTSSIGDAAASKRHSCTEDAAGA